MPRSPRARATILAAASRVVRDRGAAALTFEEVVAASGVTRGGITYHFPTKDHLLRALVERDREDWERTLAAHRAACACGPEPDLVAYIRSSTQDDADHRRFVSGMLGAVAHDPGLLASCRDFYRAQVGACRWTDAELRHLMLRMAADGLFWMETFGFLDLPSAARRRFVALLESLAAAGSAPDRAAAAAPATRRIRKRTIKKSAASGKGRKP
ncbi:MAG: TetR/AcrR family transcriptional regulator [Pseudomonadota bacterium]